MQSTLTPQETDPHDIFLIEPEIVRAARANPAPPPDPVHEVLSLLAHRAAHRTSDVAAPDVFAGASIPPIEPSIPPVDTRFRAAAVDTIKAPLKAPRDRSAFGRWAKSTSIAFLFALCSAIAAATWKHHGDAARQTIANWLPPFALVSSSPTATPPPPAEQADPSPTQTAVTDQAPVQSAQPSENAAPAAAAAADSTPSVQPSVQSMARDLATMGQQIEQLKASIEQLKAGQAQMSRDIVKASEQNLRPRIAALPPRPLPTRRPKPAFQPASTATASTLPPLPSAAPPMQPALSPPAPPQATVEPDGEPVVRPPMPLR